MKLALPDQQGVLSEYRLIGSPITPSRLPANSARVIYAAAHVVADPVADETAIDWDATLAFRRYLAGLGLGIAEAMDTAQRGMGLDWESAYQLIKRSTAELPNARVANGVGSDHLPPTAAHSLADIERAYFSQLEAVQALDARVIVMASRALAKTAQSPKDYISVYGKVLQACDHPAILHWLGDMFDPMLAGYWGVADFDQALEVVLEIISDNLAKVDGIKLSLLDKDKEIRMRRRLPQGVKMYTGDDFNYPELIAGDNEGFSHALLGIFDPLAGAAAKAVMQLTDTDMAGFHATLTPTVPLARHIFRPPTQYYKTGVVFLAWLNGFQNHFMMLGGAQAARSLPYFVSAFQYADQCGVLRDPELAISRMKRLLAMHGLADA